MEDKLSNIYDMNYYNKYLFKIVFKIWREKKNCLYCSYF